MSARNHLLMPAAAVLFGLTACTATPAPAPASAPPSAAPTSAVSPSAAPTPAVSPSAAPATSDVPATAAPTATAGCPSAKALEKLVDLPKGWYFKPSSVECWKGWAWADPETTTPGDGIYLFKYTAGQGWRYHSQGSGYHCEDLGIHESAPFCQYG
jgi:hypothetical protein